MMEAKRKAYLKGKSRPAIWRNLTTLEVNSILIKRTIERYQETQSIKDRPKLGRPRSKTTPGIVNARIAINYRRNTTKLAKDFNMSATTMRNLMQPYLGMFPYKLKRQQHLSSKVNAKDLRD
uniref:DUF4817 domain-containing protein n=1 Tax=Lepeophtheirus salmonis TaxID=72036 RepID=A0A0K2T731_LEPSM